MSQHGTGKCIQAVLICEKHGGFPVGRDVPVKEKGCTAKEGIEDRTDTFTQNVRVDVGNVKQTLALKVSLKYHIGYEN